MVEKDNMKQPLLKLMVLYKEKSKQKPEGKYL